MFKCVYSVYSDHLVNFKSSVLDRLEPGLVTILIFLHNYKSYLVIRSGRQVYYEHLMRSYFKWKI